jgi:hypothetical protein
MEIRKDNGNILYINDSPLHPCPHIHIYFGEKKIAALAATGAETTIILQHICTSIIAEGCPSVELQLQSVVMVTAFGNRVRSDKASPGWISVQWRRNPERISSVETATYAVINGAHFLRENKIILN